MKEQEYERQVERCLEYKKVKANLDIVREFVDNYENRIESCIADNGKMLVIADTLGKIDNLNKIVNNINLGEIVADIDRVIISHIDDRLRVIEKDIERI